MAITIDPQNRFEDVWAFFLQWLTLLKGPESDAAFRLLDGCSGEQFDGTNFEEFLREFSGDPNERHNYQYIDLEDVERLDDCKSDSSVGPLNDGNFFALLYMPLRGGTHDLVPLFRFVQKTENQYNVFLHIDNNVLIL
jgi:hypothetical protein